MNLSNFFINTWFISEWWQTAEEYDQAASFGASVATKTSLFSSCSHQNYGLLTNVINPNWFLCWIWLISSWIRLNRRRWGVKPKSKIPVTLIWFRRWHPWRLITDPRRRKRRRRRRKTISSPFTIPSSTRWRWAARWGLSSKKLNGEIDWLEMDSKHT